MKPHSQGGPQGAEALPYKDVPLAMDGIAFSRLD